MKKIILPLLLILTVGMLAAVESEPSAIVGYVKYDCVVGLNLVALPMNQNLDLASDIGMEYAGLTDAISYWDASTQTWYSAVYYPDFEMWDPDFTVSLGSVLMIYAVSPFSFYSIGTMPASNAQYSLIPGLNTIMVPLNKPNLTMASEVGLDIATVDAVSEWDALTQTWYSAVYYPDFELWDPDFSVSIAKPLMVYSTSSSLWPPSPRSNIQLNPSKSKSGR